MFARVGTPGRNAHNGLGIGLALARGLVEMHGGRIEARSEGLGRGSSLIVRLPVLAERTAAQPSQPTGHEAADPTTPLRILIADDNRDVVDSLALLLELTGYSVERAYDGLQAVEAAERYRPDLVLLDIGMPKLDGYEACRRIREQPWGRALDANRKGPSCANGNEPTGCAGLDCQEELARVVTGGRGAPVHQEPGCHGRADRRVRVSWRGCLGRGLERAGRVRPGAGRCSGAAGDRAGRRPGACCGRARTTARSRGWS
jgi:hypothetical protein